MLFNWWIGLIIAIVGSSIGASFAFFIARYFIYPRILGIAHRYNKSNPLSYITKQDDWKFVALLRLTAIPPFNFQSYLCGISPLNFKSYLIGSALGMLPFTLLHFYIGYSSKLAMITYDKNSSLQTIALSLSIIFTVFISIYLTLSIKRNLSSVGLKLAD